MPPAGSRPLIVRGPEAEVEIIVDYPNVSEGLHNKGGDRLGELWLGARGR